MFTGIVTAVGRVAEIQDGGGAMSVTIEAPYRDLEKGESIAVNGVCLTVADLARGGFRVDVTAPTRARTRLGELRVGDRVNLERALALGDRLGGHLVSGHVDGIAEVAAVRREQDVVVVELVLPAEVAEVTIPRGSIAVDGVSLTVQELRPGFRAEVALVPFTREHTTLGSLSPGSRVHVEGDLIGKFVRQLLASRQALQC
ncbi:MAG: riboflavin synthase [Gemmatimonadales bacterium]|nr:MAG: riboflavin synthase [Gemmatimonadales bacterium]